MRKTNQSLLAIQERVRSEKTKKKEERGKNEKPIPAIACVQKAGGAAVLNTTAFLPLKGRKVKMIKRIA